MYNECVLETTTYQREEWKEQSYSKRQRSVLLSDKIGNVRDVEKEWKLINGVKGLLFRTEWIANAEKLNHSAMVGRHDGE